MKKIKQLFSRKILHLISGIFLVISIIVFISLGFSVQYQDLKDTYALAQETTSFLETECQKFDNYSRGISARSLQDLLDIASGLKDFIAPEKLQDSDFLQTFIREEHLSGVIITDDTLSVLSYADFDHQDSPSLWKDTMEKESVKNILSHPKKKFVECTVVNDIPYDYAAVSSDGGKMLIFCYASAIKPVTDPYEFSISNVLTNNSFHKNPTVIITNGNEILSTNNSDLDDLSQAQYQKLNSSIKWKNNQLTKFKYQNTTWYGLRRIYGNYFIYAVYPSNEVFSNRTNFISFGFMIYLALCVLVLSVHTYFDKTNMHKMEKQLQIINAISTSYESTFLLHINPIELEAIKPSTRLNAHFEKHPNPYDFLLTVCKNEIAPEYYPAVMNFFEFDTLAERLSGQSFLGKEMKDIHGTWYSILLIPQSYDTNGNVQAVLVTTRDVTAIKQAEELSFKDTLTGLHNRNYMESRSKNFVRSGDLPVSLIMADCNYLKRTNDTLGHEFGDLLLQRVASAIKESIPENCVAMRVGGDEFLILCTHCSGEKAEHLISTIQENLVRKSDTTLTLSVSFGVFTTEDENFSFKDAYELADQEMYRNKQASRIQR